MSFDKLAYSRSDKMKEIRRRHHSTPEYKERDKKYRATESYKEAQKEVEKRRQERKRQMKMRAVEYKGGKCSICSYSKCFEALDFHHINPSEKEFSISKTCKKTWDVLKVELDKCILVCANCHREIHFSKDDPGVSVPTV